MLRRQRKGLGKYTTNVNCIWVVGLGMTFFFFACSYFLIKKIKCITSELKKKSFFSLYKHTRREQCHIPVEVLLKLGPTEELRISQVRSGVSERLSRRQGVRAGERLLHWKTSGGWLEGWEGAERRRLRLDRRQERQRTEPQRPRMQHGFILHVGEKVYAGDGIIYILYISGCGHAEGERGGQVWNPGVS